MIKRLFDIIASFFGLLLFSPILLIVCFLIWIQDFSSPFYFAKRVGKNEILFTMVKLRSMIVNAESSGVDSTSSDDKRITWIGKFVRKCKLDEITQLWNVFLGQMSLVGPRPNVKRETDLYTKVEKKLLLIKPGITDFSSIVFSDEGEILQYKSDPDLVYNQLIRPWKSRLGLFYIDNRSFLIDIKIIVVTVIAIVSRDHALKYLSGILKMLGASDDLLKVSLRQSELLPTHPPGALKIVENRAF
jgi:lipopolysaccharide/colanic/teichoic acid biosynthesis glycosyltransferase